MNVFSSIQAETVQRVCEIVAILAGVLAVGALIGQTMTGRIVNARQALKIRELDIKRLELEDRVSPRRLTGDQKASLVKLLADQPAGVVIVSSLLDAESSDFADDFDSALRDAHWETLRITNRTVKAYAVSLGTLEGSEPPQHMQRLSDALTSIGIAHQLKTFSEEDRTRISPYFEKGYLYLVIDKKPPYEPPK